MEKGFSEKKEQNDTKTEEIKTKKGLAAFLAGKKFTYTLPGKRQINVFATIVLVLNIMLSLGVIFYFKNQSFRDFIFNIGR